MTATALLAATLTALGGAVPGAAPPDPHADIERFVEALHPLGFDGIFMLAVDGEPVIVEGCGLANRETGLPWTAETVSTVGSITKQFTAAGILKMREMGEIRLLDTLADHFKDVPADKRHITIHHLLTHTSGIQDPPGVIDHTENTRDEYADLVLNRPLAFEPGSEFRYSNAGYSLLGAIIEQTSGQSYERWMREHIFLPAGMTRTGYIHGDWTMNEVAVGYVGDERWGTVLERPMADDGPYWMLRANGGIHSTARDMLRWANALISGDVLSRGSVDLLWAPHVPEPNGHYGYGWTVDYAPDGAKMVMHDGGNGRVAANFRLLPGRGVVVFTMTNTAATSSLVHKIPENVLNHLGRNEPLAELPITREISDTALSRYEGRYRLPSGGEVEVQASDNGLTLRPSGADAWAAALSSAPYDVSIMYDKTEHIQRIMDAAVQGDFQPFAEAYGDVDPERLKRAFEGSRATASRMFGPFRRHRIFGSWTDGERTYTQGEFVYAQRARPFTYVWSRNGDLLGQFSTGLPIDESINLHPAGDDRFFRFSDRFMSAKTYVFERRPEGMTLRLGQGREAVRSPD